jgi:hypothetical protein
MRPGSFNLALYRGDSYQWDFTLWQDAANTIPVDLTAVEAEAQIRDQPGGQQIMNLTCTIASNVISMVLAATDWPKFTLIKGVWDLQLTYSDGTVFTLVAGAVRVTRDVTDSS